MNILTIHQTCAELEQLFDKYDWFYSAVVEDNKSIRMYVQHMSKEVMSLIPDVMYGYHIKVGFVDYLFCEDKYTKPVVLFDIVSELEKLK